MAVRCANPEAKAEVICFCVFSLDRTHRREIALLQPKTMVMQTGMTIYDIPGVRMLTIHVLRKTLTFFPPLPPRSSQAKKSKKGKGKKKGGGDEPAGKTPEQIQSEANAVRAQILEWNSDVAGCVRSYFFVFFFLLLFFFLGLLFTSRGDVPIASVCS